MSSEIAGSTTSSTWATRACSRSSSTPRMLLAAIETRSEACSSSRSIRTARTLKASARSTFSVKAAHGSWEITDKGGSHLKAAAS